MSLCVCVYTRSHDVKVKTTKILDQFNKGDKSGVRVNMHINV